MGEGRGTVALGAWMLRVEKGGIGWTVEVADVDSVVDKRWRRRLRDRHTWADSAVGQRFGEGGARKWLRRKRVRQRQEEDGVGDQEGELRP